MLDDASSVYYLGMVLVCEGLILLLSTHVFREHVLPFADRVMAAETIEKDAKALIDAYPSFRTPHAFENDGVALQEPAEQETWPLDASSRLLAAQCSCPSFPGCCFRLSDHHRYRR